MDKFVSDNLIFFIQRHTGNIAFGHFQIARPFGLCAKHSPGLTAHTFAQVIQAGTDWQSAFRKGSLAAAINDLEEQLAHGDVDGIADQIRIQRFQQSLARQYFRCHGSRVGHAGTANGFYKSFFNDSIFDIKRQLAGSLLGRTPANTMSKTTDIFNFFDLHPFAFFRNRSRSMICAFGNGAHILDFC